MPLAWVTRCRRVISMVAPGVRHRELLQLRAHGLVERHEPRRLRLQ